MIRSELLYFLLFLSIYLVDIHGLSAQFRIYGSLRTSDSIEIIVRDISGKTLAKTAVTKRQPKFDFSWQATHPDVFQIQFGELKDWIYMDSLNIKVSGYYNHAEPASSSFSFDGTQKHQEIMSMIPEESFRRIYAKSVPLPMLSATEKAVYAFMMKQQTYEFNRLLYEDMQDKAADSQVERWFKQYVDSLSQFARGIPAKPFRLADPAGKYYEMSDFKGKITVLDFWASWCGPCMHTMREIMVYYPEIKDQVNFVSISLDHQGAAYTKALADLQIPWLSLWEPEGFKNSTLKAAYGFKTIPFCVVVDEQGIILERDIQSASLLYDYLINHFNKK